MSNLPEGWDTYDPDDHERSAAPGYRAARDSAAQRAERRRGAYGEMLASLRRARSLTQVVLAEQLGVAQGEVSRGEHQTDLLLSTFARYVEAMGGDLSMVVRLGGLDVIELSLALADLGEDVSCPNATVQPDPLTLAELAFYNGRYDSQEEKYFAQLTA